MNCQTCAHLKSWYHGTESDPGNFTHTCAMTGLPIEDPEGTPPDWCTAKSFLDPANNPGMIPEVLDALEEVRPFGT